MCGIRPPIPASDWKMTMTSQFLDRTSSSKFFYVILLFLSSLATAPSFMSVSLLALELWRFSFVRDWPEIQKSEIPPSEFCPISRQVINTKFGTNVSNRMLLNVAKIQGYSFYRFWVIKGKPSGGGGGITPTPTQVRVKALISMQLDSTRKKKWRRTLLQKSVFKVSEKEKLSWMLSKTCSLLKIDGFSDHFLQTFIKC